MIKWWCEEVTLRFIASVLHKKIQLNLLFDSFRNNTQTQVMGQSNGCLDNRRIIGAMRDVLN